MLALHNELCKERTLATVHNIYTTLLVLTERQVFTTLDFLNDTTKVLAKLREISGTDSTYKTHISRIMAVLKGGETYDKYKAEFDNAKARYAAHIESHVKTEREEEKLVPWERVMEVRTKLLKDTANEVYRDKSRLTRKQYEMFQIAMLVVLYTELPPRRNDYAIMNAVRKEADATDKAMNYYAFDTKKFIFNNYKTFEKYGVQTVEAPPMVADIVETVVGRRMFEKQCDCVPFLINQNGERINANTGISRLMTKAFGTPMGCTAMRHIYLANAFPDLLEETEKRRKVAEGMAHSMAEQIRYIKR